MEYERGVAVSEAVCRRMLDTTVQAVKDRNQDMPSDVIEAMIEEAVAAVRSEGRSSSPGN
jgi:hypothetical protein